MLQTKKVTLLYASLISVLCLLLSGCDSGFFDKVYKYTPLAGSNVSFNLEKSFYEVNHGVGSLIDCSTDEFPKCIQFEHTVIMIPKDKIFNEFEDGHYVGANEKLNLEYNITEVTLPILGKYFHGYLFYVASPEEMMYGQEVLGNLKGIYFYSKTDGVLFYENYNEIVQMVKGKGKTRITETYWSSTACGFFANNCSQ